jgi:ABC-type multidrug transport system fused ATPase/permease subunit
MASVAERVIATIRRELYTHIQGMPLSFFASLHSAELMTRVVNDVSRLARLSSTVLRWCKAGRPAPSPVRT